MKKLATMFLGLALVLPFVSMAFGSDEPLKKEKQTKKQQKKTGQTQKKG